MNARLCLFAFAVPCVVLKLFDADVGVHKAHG